MEWGNFRSDSDMDVDNEEEDLVTTQRGRKNIRRIKELEDLKFETRIASANEKDRIIRIKNKEKKLEEVLGKYQNELILDYDFINKMPLVTVHKSLVQKLKDHQKQGVKFMWDSCYESVEQIKLCFESGCILAHCMGLGKTFQVIAFVHTLLNHPQVATKNVLICCPKNTVLNWINEFKMWITPDLGSINVYDPTRFKNHSSRLEEISKWHTDRGVCIMNYELLRILLEGDTNGKSYKYLCNPGPDIVICDEGHVLKNEETKLSHVMSQIRTRRRVVLTGTPLQNNLIEYHCMIQFVKPDLLGSRNEFVNMFVNPILNGQYENSSLDDVRLMKERSHILYKKLQGCVQRFDLSILEKFLPKKVEFVISVALNESQVKMYKYYLDNYSARKDTNWSSIGIALLADYQFLQRIWTHPYTLKNYAEKYQESYGQKKNKLKRKKKVNESEEDSSDPETSTWSRIPLFWWVRYVTIDDIDDARKSNKLSVLLKILKKCEETNEKILVFSGSLYSLRLIQYFLKKINEANFEDPCLCNYKSTWEEELDYVILTGKTSREDRDRYCKSFNDDLNPRLRLFLISTKAGGIGINLTAANRAILFDVSWNPSHDIQSIFRIYRMGQKKPCYIYRLVASGTMEEIIYERQVAKQSISYRVVDEKQIARHYTQRELLELYLFKPTKNRKLNNTELNLTKDPLLEQIFEEEAEKIIGIHEHDSLLEHKKEEELKELEKTDAWTSHNNVDDFKNLPVAVKKMLFQLKPESFELKYLKMVLQNEYPEASDEEISIMMTELTPKVNHILKRPDFIVIMKKQALFHHHKTHTLKSEKNLKTKKPLSITHKKTIHGKENEIARFTDSIKSYKGHKGHYSEDNRTTFSPGIKNKRRKTKKKSQPLSLENSK